MKIGYFHTFHFECEPGTVFSDDLDQCVFPHLIGPPCGTAGEGPVTPTPPATCVFEDQDCYTQQLCQPDESRVYCTKCRRGQQTITTGIFCGEAGAVYDKGLGQCVPTPVPASRQCPTPTPPTPPTPPPTPQPCIFEDQDCKTQQLCQPSEERVICERCRRGQEIVTAGIFCGVPGLVYERTRGLCVAANIPASRQCAPPTPKPPQPIVDRCVFNASVCEKRELCQPQEVVTLCKQCYFGATLVDYCGKNKLYDLDRKICVPEPDASRKCQEDNSIGSLSCLFNDSVCEKRALCNPTETKTLCKHCYVGEALVDYCDQSKGLIYDLDLRECVAEPGDSRVCSASVIGQNTVECTDSNTRPGHDWIKRFYCTRYNLCDANNKYKTAVNLCTNYYQCYKNADGSWFVEKRNCVGGKLYSFDNDRCEDRPSDDQLCT